MRTALMVILVIALYVLHQDSWFWRTTTPMILGFIPIGLTYHAGFTLAVSLVMWLLVKYAWPSHLEQDGPHDAAGGQFEAEEGDAR